MDAGSNTVRPVAAESRDGVPPPVHTAQWKLRLSQQVAAVGRLGETATEELVKALDAAGRDGPVGVPRIRRYSPPPSYAPCTVRCATPDWSWATCAAAAGAE
ncbi:hypothetical protein [Streptomyces sp. NPDC059224]|uniref:hypothetical protein n=1 Tax=Streptomyces sp. NPDC059224 TaxID=3346775 RepID=UPI0036AB02CE